MIETDAETAATYQLSSGSLVEEKGEELSELEVKDTRRPAESTNLGPWGLPGTGPPNTEHGLRPPTHV